LAEELSRGAFDGFYHSTVVFGVNADFKEPLACLQVAGFVESDFSCAEFAEAEVEPCVVGSFFLEADFYAFQIRVPTFSWFGWFFGIRAF
jgi:hypothetical protein